MAAMPNLGGVLCSKPQSVADTHYYSAVQYRCQEAKPVEICWGALKLANRSQPLVGLSSPYCDHASATQGGHNDGSDQPVLL